MMMRCRSRHLCLMLAALALIWASAVSGAPAQNESAIEWFMKGYDYYNLGRINESMEAYNRSLQLNPRDYEAWNNMGIDQGLLGRKSEALASFKNAVALNQSYAQAWYNMGVIYDALGDPYAAVQAYKRATQIDPEYQKAWVRRNVNTDMMMARSLSCACQNQIDLF